MSEFAPDLEVLERLWWALCWPGAFNRVEWSQPDGWCHWDYPFESFPAWRDVVLSKAQDREVLISVGLRPKLHHGTCGSARVLWVRAEGKKEAAALLRFRPAPTIILREGATSRMTALWQLHKPLPYEYLVRANKRIAHKLFAPKKWAAPEFAFAMPGSCLRVDRARPVPVHVEQFNDVVYTPRQVVGKLREAPDADAWRAAA